MIMCPKKPEGKSTPASLSDWSDCSLDEERQVGTPGRGPCHHGYRHDLSADGAPDSIKALSKQVEAGSVIVGDADNKTRLIDRFAGGSFGELYLGEILNSDSKRVAVKVEPIVAGGSFLLQEGNVYRNLEGGPGIPQVYWFGYYGPEFGVMTMDLLGPTLEDVFASLGRTFKLKTLLMLADQMLSILDFVHGQGYVHRDISPSNFVLGGDGARDKIYLIDFGHAKKYNPSFKIQPRRTTPQRKAVVGTPRFISVHAHLGHEDSPRNDLESLGYILLYLAHGSLPWQGIQANDMVEKLNKIAEVKINIPLNQLCRSLPEEFITFFAYIRGLQLYLALDYNGCRDLFKEFAKRNDIEYDRFDWEEEEEGEERQTATDGQETGRLKPKPVLPGELGSSDSGSLSQTPPSR